MQLAIANETAEKFQPLSKIARFETLHTLHVCARALCICLLRTFICETVARLAAVESLANSTDTLRVGVTRLTKGRW